MGRDVLDAFLASLPSGLAGEVVAHVAEGAAVASGIQRHAAGHDCEWKDAGYRVSVRLGGEEFADGKACRVNACIAAVAVFYARHVNVPFSPRVLMSPVDRRAFSFIAPAKSGERLPVSLCTLYLVARSVRATRFRFAVLWAPAVARDVPFDRT